MKNKLKRFNYKNLIPISLDINLAMDVEQLLNGGFKPLRTFMNYTTLNSVLEHMRLPSGQIWPVPILFHSPLNMKIYVGDSLLLKIHEHELAILKVSNIFKYNKTKLIKLFFGTESNQHPGVFQTKKLSNTFITGKLTRIEKLSKILKIPALEPPEVKAIIRKKKWKKITGFHTRNPPHRAHEFLQKNSLENSDGLLIHPVVGSKKSGDFTNKAIIKSYTTYLEKYMPKKNVIFTPLLTYSRYAGPKEAVFTAIIRHNYGCTHFIVGRDHTGVKNFYGKYDSQKIFKNFNNLGIKIISYDEPYFCKKCDQITTSKTCPHNKKYYIEISGSKIRKAILNQSNISDKLIRREVLLTLQKMKNIFVH